MYRAVDMWCCQLCKQDVIPVCSLQDVSINNLQIKNVYGEMHELDILKVLYQNFKHKNVVGIF